MELLSSKLTYRLCCSQFNSFQEFSWMHISLVVLPVLLLSGAFTALVK